MQEQRSHPRYRTNEDAELTASELAAPCRASLLDISLGGCRVRTERPLRTGLTLTISMLGALAANVPGEVRYCTDDDGSFTTGVRFCPSNHEERLSLAKAVFTINQRHWAW